MTTPLRLQAPKYTSLNGVRQKTFTDVDGVIMANFKTYGGTERISDDVYILEDTAEVVTWYRPDITAGCRVVLLDSADSATYEIIGAPEDIELRHMVMKFKCKRIKGGV